jgi:hypothetical protein
MAKDFIFPLGLGTVQTSGVRPPTYSVFERTGEEKKTCIFLDFFGHKKKVYFMSSLSSSTVTFQGFDCGNMEGEKNWQKNLFPNPPLLSESSVSYRPILSKPTFSTSILQFHYLQLLERSFHIYLSKSKYQRQELECVLFAFNAQCFYYLEEDECGCG